MDSACFITDFSIEIDIDEVWRWLGSHGRKGDPRLAEEVARTAQAAGELAEPKAVYARLKVRSVDAQGVLLENGERLNGAHGPQLAEQFSGAAEAFVVVVTVGSGIESQVQRLFAEKRPLEAVILDAAGSAASSAVSRYVNGCLYQQAEQDGLEGGRIIRPGSQYWDLLGQRTLFAMLPTERIGVSLTSSCLILPRKSGSGVIPLGHSLANRHEPSESSCRHCPNVKCIARIEIGHPGS